MINAVRKITNKLQLSSRERYSSDAQKVTMYLQQQKLSALIEIILLCRIRTLASFNKGGVSNE